MSRTVLSALSRTLDERTNRLSTLDAYYAGNQPLTYLAPEAKTALGNRLQQVSVNVPRLVVSSLTERLRVTNLVTDAGADLWTTWLANDMDQLSGIAHREALALGSAFVIVWAGPTGARITVESARQVTVTRDPATRQVTSALKRWTDNPSAAGVPGTAHAVTYEPDVITVYRCDAAGAPADTGAWTVVDTIPNPLGVVPVVPLVNTERLLDTEGTSAFADVIPLTDALVKLSTDLLVTSEFFARPRRWATGVEVPEDENGNAINPFASEADRTWISEAPESKFGQFAATDLAAYDTAVKVVLQQISAVSALPQHYLGVVTGNPANADAIRAGEAALTARAEHIQRSFGRSWEAVGNLAAAVATGTDPSTVGSRVSWADPATRSVAQDADAAVKLVQAGILPPSEALRRLGYSASEVERIRAAKRAESLDTVDLGAMLGTTSQSREVVAQ